MKKNYYKPSIRMKNVEPSKPVATSGTIGAGGEENPPVKEWDSNSRRGNWGNLWNEDDE